MKIIALILFISTLAGCDNGGGDGGNTDYSTYPPLDEQAVGDSLTCREGSAYERLEITRYCRSGRMLIEVESLPARGTVYLQMGGNDTRKNVAPATFELHLLGLLDNTDADVICVLPVINLQDTSVVREILMRNCPGYIDPMEYGIQGLNDGVHWTQDENLLFVDVLEALRGGDTGIVRQL